MLDFTGHMTVHKPKTACDFCGKLVSRMREHLESMHQADSDMSYRCDLCGKGFPTSQKLRDHNMNVHLKLRPYTCRYIFQMSNKTTTLVFCLPDIYYISLDNILFLI